MDDFKPNKNRPSSSLDGFVSGQPNRAGNLRTYNRYYRPNQASQPNPVIPDVDNFKNPDGFRQMSQPALQSPGAHNKPEEITFADGSTRRHEETRRRVEKLKQKSHRGHRFSLRRKRKEKTAHKHPKRRMALRLSAVLGAFIILVGGGLLLRAILASRNIFKGGGNSAVLNNQNVDPSLLKGEGDGRVNILMLGKGGEEQTKGPDLTDTIIIASIDPIAKESALLSIPRDFWVKSPGGYQSKINEIYANAKSGYLNDLPFNQRNTAENKDKAEKAGTDAIKKVVSDTMGIPIHYHVMIDFEGFRKAIDTVGGIDINVTDSMAVSEVMYLAEVGRYNLDVDPGQQHFDGTRALAFSRSRKTSARGDFSRAERQRAVIVALKEKVLSTGTLANPLKLNQLISDFSGRILTDFSTDEIMRVYDLSKEISGDKVLSVGLDEYVKGDMINGQSVQVPKAGTFDYSEIQNYVRNVMRDSFLKSEDAKIMILNGTDRTGLATSKSKELKSFGYNIVSVGDAPTKSYQNTVLVDLTKGKKRYTLSYLEKRLGVESTNVLPDGNINPGAADFVIILGADQR